MKFLTFEETREEFGLSFRTLRRLVNMKDCPQLPRKKHGQYQINKERFAEFLDNQKR